ncbi:MAG: PIN domain-containing protein [Geminicoccaceae bacterium]
MYLLDTVALSALMKPGTAPAAEAWFGGIDLDELHLPAPALAEIRRGIARLPEGGRKTALREAYDSVLLPLLASCVAFDADAALVWGELMGTGDATGRQHPIIDTQIAAIALVHDLTVVTRNLRDFAPLGVPTVDPWTE